MASLTLRLAKGSPLTNQEIDDNFSNLNTEIATKLNAAEFNSNDILTELLAVDGAGSGLDADLLDGYQPSSSSITNTIVLRDSSGNFAANEITANKFVGNLELGSLKTLTFEGATNDAYETTLSVVDPTADRTILFPNESGTVVLTGGSSSANSITTAMLQNGSVTNVKLQYSTISINGESVALGSNIDTTDNNYTWTGTHYFTDSNLRLRDNADTSKQVQFQVSSITTGTTRTLVLPNENATLATQDYVQRTGYNSQGVKTISTAAPSGGSNGDVWYRV